MLFCASNKCWNFICLSPTVPFVKVWPLVLLFDHHGHAIWAMRCTRVGKTPGFRCLKLWMCQNAIKSMIKHSSSWTYRLRKKGNIHPVEQHVFCCTLSLLSMLTPRAAPHGKDCWQIKVWLFKNNCGTSSVSTLNPFQWETLPKFGHQPAGHQPATKETLATHVPHPAKQATPNHFNNQPMKQLI